MTRPSERVLDQRLRNRIIEVLSCLKDGENGVNAVGAKEYFEWWYDLVPHRDMCKDLPPNTTMTPQEVSAINAVRAVIDAAYDDDSYPYSEEGLIQSEWPNLVQILARRAFLTMMERGQFGEEEEEADPSVCYLGL